MIDGFSRKLRCLRVSVTELCDLRCRYCMPEEGVCKKSRDEMLTEDELIGAISAAASLGVTKIRITGGEPLIKPNILSICRRAALVPGVEELCLTTNGTRLSALAAPLRAAGLVRVNMSLDSLDPEKYAYITRRGRLSDALSGLRAALDAGFERVKINAVLIGGFNDDEIPALAGLTRENDIDLRFIELMPMCGGFGPEAFIPASVVLERLPELAFEGTEGVARLYRLPGARGRVGLISPISRSFCGGCDRLRLTADGKIRPCLHSPAEFSLKGLDGAAMRRQFLLAAGAKPERHGELSARTISPAGRAMNRIGG